jgi:threonine/homoserine/homoserine lactone efflux protein
MAINNSSAFGQCRSVLSSIGNACGLFCLPATVMLRLGALLASSEWLLYVVKVIGAGSFLTLDQAAAQ